MSYTFFKDCRVGLSSHPHSEREVNDVKVKLLVIDLGQCFLASVKEVGNKDIFKAVVYL